MKILLVIAHPRQTSLTHAAAMAFADGAKANGHQIETADLVAENFDPVTRVEDEPDWDNPRKTYSPAVQSEWARIERNDATVMVWPVWGWSFPAILKGWTDRVWNYGWAYGERGQYRYPHQRVWSIGLGGGTEAQFAKRGYDKAIEVQIETGLLRYCGVPEPRQILIYDTLEGADQASAAVAAARRLGEEF